MKKLGVAICVFVLVSCSSLTHEKWWEVYYTYGYVGASDCKIKNSNNFYPVDRRECNHINVIKESQEIQIFPGVAFGVEYEILNLTEKDCYTVTHKLTHPEMQTPVGKRSVYSRDLKVGNCNLNSGSYSGIFSWLVEKEWEAVKGIWEFEILLDGNVIIEQKIKAI